MAESKGGSSAVLERLRQTQADLEESQRLAQRAQGRLEALQAEVLRKYGVKTLAEARQKLKALEADLAEREQEERDLGREAQRLLDSSGLLALLEGGERDG